MAIESFADNFIPVVPVDGELEHTDIYPFCWDETCDCHEDDEATDFVLGKLL